ncbi:hypothetical protein BKA63DRAFT_497839 [Paraphoma chrysanthemicola]|nr:hypothetical protein BKA63DRAFT_497839 [Paraphoma chrysanthemicola]
MYYCLVDGPPSPATPARDRALTKRNITAAWAAAGLFPFNPDRVLRDTPKPPAEVTGLQEVSVRHWYSQALVGYEKTFRPEHDKCKPLRNKLALLVHRTKGQSSL